MFTVKAETNFGVNEYLDHKLYGEKGLYLNDDGIAYSLILVEESYATSLTVPREYIVKYKQIIGESGIDLLQKQLSELNYANKKLVESYDLLVDESSDMSWRNEMLTAIKNTSSNDVDLAGLTKLIAVAQKPDLLKGK